MLHVIVFCDISSLQVSSVNKNWGSLPSGLWLIWCPLLLSFGLSILVFGFNFFVLVVGIHIAVLRVDMEITSKISFPSDELCSAIVSRAREGLLFRIVCCDSSEILNIKLPKLL